MLKEQVGDRVSKAKELAGAVKEVAEGGAEVVTDKDLLEAQANKIAKVNPEWEAEMQKYNRCENSTIAKNLIITTGAVAVGGASAGLVYAAGSGLQEIPVVGKTVPSKAVWAASGAAGVAGGVVGAYKALDRIEDHERECHRTQIKELDALLLADVCMKEIEDAVSTFLEKIQKNGVRDREIAFNRVMTKLTEKVKPVDAAKKALCPEQISNRAVRRTQPLTFQAPQSNVPAACPVKPGTSDISALKEQMYAPYKNLLKRS